LSRDPIQHWNFFIALSFFRGASFLLDWKNRVKQKDIDIPYTEKQLEMMSNIAASHGLKKCQTFGNEKIETVGEKMIKKENLLDRLPIKTSDAVKRKYHELWNFMETIVIPSEKEFKDELILSPQTK
jgi:hypothetical protein